MPGENSTSFGARSARFVQRHFLWLLAASYILAACWPGPGLAMRNWKWPSANNVHAPFTVPLVLLAIMLFSAALLTDWQQVRIIAHHPLILVSALAAVWLGPLVLVFAAGWIIPAGFDGPATTGLLVAFALVASMPVANSSVGWTQSAGGNLALGLSLVLLSITLSPWVTPHLLSLLGLTLSARERAYIDVLVAEFSGVFFIIWVILPTAAGFIARQLLTPARVTKAKAGVGLVSAAALLALNYINSALALPKVIASPKSLLVATTLLAASLSIMGLLLGWSIASFLRLKPETRAALMFGLSMKHTGLALILAAAVLQDEPLAILLIALATLLQHLLAGIAHWFMNRSARDAAGRLVDRGTCTEH